LFPYTTLFRSESVIHRQLAVHFPCVRCIQRDKVLRKIFWIRIGLMEGRGVSGQEVDHRRTKNARKDEGTLGPCVRVSVEQGAHRAHAEAELMRAPNDAQIVIEPKVGGCVAADEKVRGKVKREPGGRENYRDELPVI